ncbi:mannosyl phosphorylinositol ceramide synthase csh1 [Acrodontium crateriforme]|uniref:Mannosyl phosphorylinositol ceramide synthase csh1 n=1 Tax=Acrodontium crateriforme TaxID=150365 RepID=A0AAQ3M3Z5_9PEZI|nr:mannosyl phosphorylinositol ceramide synthase csh1 [Acrodontium crateriforme]
MRRGLLLFLLLNVAIILFLVNSVWTLLTLLVVDGSEDAISKAELPAPGSDLIDDRPQLIPKIIHQTYKNTSIPPVWQEAQTSCLNLHPAPQWEYKLWTDEKSMQFIEAEYPWFLDTFRGYQYPIQRADSIRYFVLAHYGGVYIDFDDGCNRALEPLLSYPAFVRRTMPTGISNDVMGAVPQHPFFMRVIEEIQNYDKSWIMPYITVMASTGPLFLSIIWRRYTAAGLNFGDGADGGRVRILFPDEYNNYSWSFFIHHLGNSWHGKDVQLIFWMARNWVLLTIIGFTVGFSVIFSCWWAYHRFVLASRPAPEWKVATIRQRLPFWRRVSAQKEYELVRRHEV